MDMSNTEHLLLTRFNVRSPGKEQVFRARPDWLQGRFELFERYCLPSVLAQTEKNFKWLIFFDTGTPKMHKDWLSELHLKNPWIKIIYIDEWVWENVKACIDGVRDCSREYLLTTRLDNDDAIHPRFMETIQSQPGPGSDCYFNFHSGLVLNNGVGFAHTHRSNAFLSRLERATGYRTAWEGDHTKVIKQHQVVQLDLPYAWVQVVHGENVSNKIRGYKVGPSRWYNQYQHLGLSQPPQPSTVDLYVDYVIHIVYRSGRDLLIEAAKRMLALKQIAARGQ